VLAQHLRWRIQPGECIRSRDCGGGGYGLRTERDSEHVRHDVIERWVSCVQARDVYGVVFTGSDTDDTLAVDRTATSQLREQLRARKS
jgi:N-methylhydantoinase B